MTRRVLVTGSRDWSDRDTVWWALKAEADEHGADNLVIVHGACPRGADSWADLYGLNYGIRIERHPARWGEFGKAAGFRRNAEMVKAGADVCLAFLAWCTKRGCSGMPHYTHGAQRCVDVAESAGIPVRRWTS